MKHVVAPLTDQPQDTSSELSVGIHSARYLADHRVQDMVVLPGSFYIATALLMARKRSKSAVIIRNAIFRNAVILAASDSIIKLSVRNRGDNRAQYTFNEANVEDGEAAPYGGQYA